MQNLFCDLVSGGKLWSSKGKHLEFVEQAFPVSGAFLVTKPTALKY